MNRNLLAMSYTARKEKHDKDVRILVNFLFSFILIHIFFNFIICPVKQTSKSMVPDIPENSYVMVSPMMKNPQRGDVVLIKAKTSNTNNFFKKVINPFVKFFTGQQISLTENMNVPGTKPHLRRIIALPGDTIYMKDFLVYVKPAGEKHFLTEYELSDSLYKIGSAHLPAGWDNSIAIQSSFDEITLKKNEYFVLGDNRISAFDTRVWGFINHNDIKGTALLCYLPIRNFKKLF